MANKRRASGRAMSMPAGIGFGVAMCLVVTLLGAAVLAWLVVTERIAQSGIGYGCMLIQTLAAAAGCIAAYMLVKHRRLMVSAITCGGYYAALLVLALIFGGIYDGMLATAMMILLGGGIAQIPGLIGGGSGVRRRKMAAYR